MKLQQKLTILADAAKFDASCASSGSTKRDSRSSKGIGAVSSGMGVCHSYAPDGRCISLLKILLTNFCIYDCSYCISRVSSDVQRARFTVEEVVKLTLDFYKRNYIEGLFLSSGIIQSSDYTMEQLVEIAKQLRLKHNFRGYIHLKTIPDASPELLRAAGLYADRLSINVELPSKQSLKDLAPEKNPLTIRDSMSSLKSHIDESKESRKRVKKIYASSSIKPKKFVYSPAGQSTQMIVGADQSNDAKILTLANRLYGRFNMRRVYYSAFSPIPHAAHSLPSQSPPLQREHRLYQADWLLRFYGFNVSEIVSDHDKKNDESGMLDLDIDPKLAWAIQHRASFPIDLNHASKEWLLRVPGIGLKGVHRIIHMRRIRQLRVSDLGKLGISEKKAAPFVFGLGANSQQGILDTEHLRAYYLKQDTLQMSLF